MWSLDNSYRKQKSVVSGVFGGGDDSGKKAARAQQEANQASIDEMKRQFNITQENIAPFMEAGQGAIPGVEAGATVGGMDEMLAQIFNSDIFGSLVGERERAVQGQLAAGGLTRSGTAMTEAARVPTDLGLMLEQLLSGRQTNLMNTGLNAAVGLGQMGQQNSANIGNTMSASGNAISSGIITDAQAKAQGSQNLLNTAATIGSMFMGFSDPRLKINVEPVADIKGLNVYQWDWTPETKGTLVEGCATIGFMADEVKEKYPQHIHEFGGFMVVDYPALLDELEAA
tara:strand:+ start:30752 stop:31606 length:855 start_codon:yes stop_codon:yes gene_type:complete